MASELLTPTSKTTVDATPVTFNVYTVLANTAVELNYTIVARTAGGEVKTWRGGRGIQRIGAAVVTAVGSSVAADIENTANAAAWTISAGGIGNSFALTLTGAAATTIVWIFYITAISNP